MTRKKFVKQLMAKGVERNDAEVYAFFYRSTGHSYTSALRDYNFRHSLTSATRQIATDLKVFSAGIMTVAEAARALGVKLKSSAGGGGND